MIARDVFTGKLVVIGFIEELVGLAGVIHTQVNGSAAAVVIGANLSFSKTRLTDVQLTVVELKSTCTDFC